MSGSNLSYLGSLKLRSMPRSHSGEVQDLPLCRDDDVSHGSIVMEFMGFFNGQPLCHLRLAKPFFLGEAHAGKSCARLAFHCCFLLRLLLLRLFHWLSKPESCTVLRFTWWWPEQRTNRPPFEKYVEF